MVKRKLRLEIVHYETADTSIAGQMDLRDDQSPKQRIRNVLTFMTEDVQMLLVEASAIQGPGREEITRRIRSVKRELRKALCVAVQETLF